MLTKAETATAAPQRVSLKMIRKHCVYTIAKYLTVGVLITNFQSGPFVAKESFVKLLYKSHIPLIAMKSSITLGHITPVMTIFSITALSLV